MKKEGDFPRPDGLADRVQSDTVLLGHPSMIKAKLSDSPETPGHATINFFGGSVRFPRIDATKANKTTGKALDSLHNRIVPHDTQVMVLPRKAANHRDINSSTVHLRNQRLRPDYPGLLIAIDLPKTGILLTVSFPILADLSGKNVRVTVDDHSTVPDLLRRRH
jgi:hypothetical protein